MEIDSDSKQVSSTSETNQTTQAPATTAQPSKPSIDAPRSIPKFQKNQKKRASPDIVSSSDYAEKGPPPIFKSRVDLEKLNPRQLIDLVVSHQQYWDPKHAENIESAKRRRTSTRDIDWEKYSVRHVAFKVAYLGWDYLGLASQVDTANTIEGCLIEAFKRVKLIQSYQDSHWSRAGRTDKGVSALGQVIALHVRSNVKKGVGIVRVGNDLKDDLDELDYVTMLNGTLPPEIRVLGWAPVPLEFDARFSAISRTYKYYFAKDDMDINAMREACSDLIGEHDFRNFCKMDTFNVKHFNRCIIHARIDPVSMFPQYDQDNDHQVGNADEPGTEHWNRMYELTISGSAFLWHQVRYMVAVLFMVGKGEESPSIVKEMLDIEKYPQKPLYFMASEIPLILYDVGYFHLKFEIDINAQRKLFEHWMDYWKEKAIKAQMARLIVTHLDNSDMIFHERQRRHLNEQMPPQHLIVRTPATSTPSANKLPKLITPKVQEGNKPSRKEVKSLMWEIEEGQEVPETIKWGHIKDQVLEAHHSRHFHISMNQRQVEDSFEDRSAKRPYKKAKLSETSSIETDQNNGDE